VVICAQKGQQTVSSQKSGVQEITPQRVAQWEKTGRLQPLC
jgi:hypothetical protein